MAGVVVITETGTIIVRVTSVTTGVVITTSITGTADTRFYKINPGLGRDFSF